MRARPWRRGAGVACASSPGAGRGGAPGDDTQVCVTVTDTGSGIPRENLENIFDPFFSTKDKGTGLGLALVQQIVVEHGGRIEVESGPDVDGGGTRFSLIFPAQRATDGRGEAAAGRDGGGAAAVPTIPQGAAPATR